MFCLFKIPLLLTFMTHIEHCLMVCMYSLFCSESCVPITIHLSLRCNYLQSTGVSNYEICTVVYSLIGVGGSERVLHSDSGDSA